MALKSSQIYPFIRILRAKQWVKNLFCFLPIFFDREIFNLHSLLCVAMVFIAFCLASSSIYCLNDLVDVNEDRNHPEKCKRPIASGQLSVRAALIYSVVLSLTSILISLTIPSTNYLYVTALIAIYLFINILYCLELKKHAIIDTFIIAIGFVIRLVAGGLIAHNPISEWIVLMTFLLSLFIAFAKRRDDVLIYNSTGYKHRRHIQRYNITFINIIMTILSTVAIICYIMYTLSPKVTERLHCDYLYLTSIFVIAAIIKYHQLTVVDNSSGSPTKVLMRNRFIQLCILCWVVSYFIILYL